MELSILQWISETLTHPILDQFFSFYTKLNNHGEMWIVLILCLILYKPTRRFGLLCGLALACEYILNDGVLKPLISRTRPFVEANIIPIIPIPSGYSMPSGHSASSFVIAFMFLLYKHKGRYLILFLAILMGFSRLYLFVHYPSDVLAGGVLGFCIAWTVYHLDLKKQSKRQLTN